MAAIYIHIPFCRSKCHYCNFFSVASKKLKEGFLPALLSEAQLQKDYLSGEPVDTIYFGGGTPSMLDTEEIRDILEVLCKCHPVANDAEITIEANPDDVLPAKAERWKRAGINRISLGIQSFCEGDLRYLNRVHDRESALKAPAVLKESGFENISIDLIYGIHGMTETSWNNNLEIFFSLEIPHLSAYSLTVEKGTPLDLFISQGKAKAPSVEHPVRQFNILMDRMEERGFVHYEISNFGLPGRFSGHNVNYWTGGKYLGLGPSAHSYDQGSRQWNVSSVSGYISSVRDGRLPFETEALSEKEHHNEYVMLALRTVWGISRQHVKNAFGRSHDDRLGKLCAGPEADGLVVTTHDRIFLTRKGKLFADRIAAGLFL